MRMNNLRLKGILLIVFAATCYSQSRWRSIKTQLKICPRPMITLLHGTKQMCVTCPICPRRRGSTVDCGDIRKDIGPEDIKCVSCKKGVTYSSSRRAGSCDPCTICQRNVQVAKKCTRVADTICGGCRHGFYPAEIVPGLAITQCEECSWCCGDEKDKVINACKNQGMPAHKQCSFRQQQRCENAAKKRAKASLNNGTHQPTPNPLHDKNITANYDGDETSQNPLPLQKDQPFTEPATVTTTTDKRTAGSLQVKSPTRHTRYSTQGNRDINVNNNIYLDSKADEDFRISMSIGIPIAVVFVIAIVIGLHLRERSKEKKKNEGRESSKKTEGQPDELDTSGNGDPTGGIELTRFEEVEENPQQNSDKPEDVVENPQQNSDKPEDVVESTADGAGDTPAPAVTVQTTVTVHHNRLSSSSSGDCSCRPKATKPKVRKKSTMTDQNGDTRVVKDSTPLSRLLDNFHMKEHVCRMLDYDGKNVAALGSYYDLDRYKVREIEKDKNPSAALLDYLGGALERPTIEDIATAVDESIESGKDISQYLREVDALFKSEKENLEESSPADV